MSSIYLILVALYLFNHAVKINNEIEKANFYRGMLIIISIICVIVSIIIHLCEIV